MISTLEEMRVWAPAQATGRLLSPTMQAQRLQTVPAPPGAPNGGHGLGVFDLAGWIGHNGTVPGSRRERVLATGTTSVISPDHLYELVPH
jgi:D-alanyl-D-alanine carboxypeptidase